MNRMFTLMTELYSVLYKLVQYVLSGHCMIHAVSLLHHDDVTSQKRK